jgi:hypothetical protein
MVSPLLLIRRRASFKVLRALHTVNLEWNASKLGVLAIRVNSDQSVTCFDPHLTVPGLDGSTIAIRAIEDFETFALYGVDIDHLGRAHLERIEARERDVCARIALSHYPIPARTAALRMVNGKIGELMAFNTWTDPDVLNELDKLERFAVRNYFKMTLPNAYVIAELHLSSRV